MDNNAVYKTPGMGSSEETEILYAIENYITTSTIEETENYTTVDMENTGVEVESTWVSIEITGGGIDNPGVLYTSHEGKNI